MSRVSNKPVTVPAAVEITENGQRLSVKGPKGTLEHQVHHLVEVAREDGELTFMHLLVPRVLWSITL